MINKLKVQLNDLKGELTSNNIDMDFNIKSKLFKSDIGTSFFREFSKPPTFIQYYITVKCSNSYEFNSEYDYLATIYPTAIMDDDKDLELYSVVIPSEKYKDRVDLINQLDKLSTKEKCARCHKAVNRGMYVAFYNTETKNIEIFGSSCAKEKFKVDFSSKVRRYIDKLFEIINNPYKEINHRDTDEDDYSWGEGSKDPIFTGGTDFLYVFSTCEYLVIRGLDNIPNKWSAKSDVLFNTILKYNSGPKTRENIENELKANNKLELLEKLESEEVKNKTIKLYDSLIENIGDFYKNYNTKSESNNEKDWKENLKFHGLAIAGYGFSRYKSIYPAIYPYAVLEYFKSLNKKEDPDEENKYSILQPFDDKKKINVKVTDIQDKTGMYGPYCLIDGLVEVDDNGTKKPAKVTFSANGKYDIKSGDVIEIEGRYDYLLSDGKTVKLYKTKVIKNLSNSGGYPDIGTRYKNVKFTVNKVDPSNSIYNHREPWCKWIVITTEDGNKYEISNYNPPWGYNDAYPKFTILRNLSDVKEGMTGMISGTVVLENGVHKLQRVKLQFN